MNLLVIGNGFDLAHGFPTSYKDFLKFISDEDLSDKFCKVGYDLINSEIFAQEILRLVDNNFWIEHFMEISDCGENWIDFESEISRIIQEIDDLRIEINSYYQKSFDEEPYDFFARVKLRFSESLEGVISWTDVLEKTYITDLKNILLKDLDRVTRCLEIYLSAYVNKLEPASKLDMLKDLDITHVLSFNYTNSFERLYRKNGVSFHYIHGKAEQKNSVDSCNMILGIDEYLQHDEKDLDNEFIQFKKFYQRIYKGTGAQYKKWLKMSSKKIKSSVSENNGNNIYILGHSLDVTDKEILRELLCHRNSNIFIIYHDKKSMGDKISNIIKVIGEDELIEKTYSYCPVIQFIEQY